MKIALCQTPIVWENVNENISHYNSVLSDISNNNSDLDLVVFPELFTYGFSINQNIAEDSDGPSSAWLREKSREYQIALVASVPIREGGKIYNRAIFATPDGSEFKYDKRHLFSYGGEDTVFTPGDTAVIVKFKGWKIFLQICYDIRFPVWSRNIGLSYDMIINMASWPSSREKVISPLVRARAIENLCYFAFVNRSGKDPFNTYQKIGFVSDFKGEPLEPEVSSDNLDYQIYELDLNALKKFREKFRAWEDSDKFNIIPNY